MRFSKIVLNFIPEEGWFGQPKYSTFLKKSHSTLYRSLLSLSSFKLLTCLLLSRRWIFEDFAIIIRSQFAVGSRGVIFPSCPETFPRLVLDHTHFALAIDNFYWAAWIGQQLTITVIRANDLQLAAEGLTFRKGRSVEAAVKQTTAFPGSYSSI